MSTRRTSPPPSPGLPLGDEPVAGERIGRGAVAAMGDRQQCQLPRLDPVPLGGVGERGGLVGHQQAPLRVDREERTSDSWFPELAYTTTAA